MTSVKLLCTLALIMFIFSKLILYKTYTVIGEGQPSFKTANLIIEPIHALQTAIVLNYYLQELRELSLNSVGRFVTIFHICFYPIIQDQSRIIASECSFQECFGN